MKKVLVSLLCIFALCAGLLSGCGKGKESAKNGELNLFIWTEYLSEGVIDKFEEETGIHVNMSTYSSNEDLLAKLKAEDDGTYDVIVPSDYMVEQMKAQDMLLELDHSKLPNFANIGAAYQSPAYDEGNQYSVPYLGGAAAIAVNTAKVDKEITSYDDLFDSSLAGTMVVLDDYRAIIGLTERSMGYSMNETDPDILKDVQEKMLKLKDNIKVYDSDSPKSSLIEGDCTIAVCWTAEIALAMDEVDTIECVYPTEGAYLFMDNLAITKGAKNVENAYKFMNFMLDADNMALNLDEFPYMCPNTKAVEKKGAEYMSNNAKNIPEDAITKGEYVSNLDVDTIALYDEMWTKLK